MPKIPILLTISVFALCGVVQSSSAIDVQGPDTYQFDTSLVDLPVNNSTDQPINVVSIENDRSRVKLRKPAIIAAKSTGYVEVEVAPENDLGASTYTVRLKSDQSSSPILQASIHTFVESAFDAEVARIDFGVVARGLNPDKEITLSTKEATNFNLVAINEAPIWANASINGDGKTISVKLNVDRPLGLVDGFIKVKTDLPQQSEVWVLVKMDSRGRVVPSQNPVDFSMLRQGAIAEQRVRLEEAQHKAFDIASVDIDSSAKIGSVVGPCEPDVVWCREMRLKVSKDIQIGQIWSKAVVHIASQSESVPVEIRGLVLPADLKVTDLNDPKYKGEAATKVVSTGNLATDIKKAVTPVSSKDSVTVPAEIEKHSTSKSGSTLHWATQRDVGVYGYLIYRSDDEKGPFVRINKDIVKASGNGQDGGAYEWRDDSGVKGHTYWYYIGLVRTNGTKQQLSGPQKAVAK